ncbi:MAG: pyridoxal phosphate-dependent aminotransferase [Desulfobacterales bacterium]|nr:pyridoxal phosphate-dependent aminotransferase [Desulfobacterales bacterium]MCP4164251.1 pyridoxal phosphate-dependent aminotransferase [Deltaproteobacteria bacterium]
MITKRVEQMTSFIVMDVLEKAKSMERDGIDVVHLEVGEPDFDIPVCVKEAACNALNSGYTHYTHSLGMIELREEICKYYDRIYNVNIHPDQIVVSSGTSPVMFSLFSTLISEGDEVIISDPHYACYPNFVEFAGGKVVNVPVYEEDGFQYRTEEIKKRLTDKTKAVLINSPSNPTGNLLSPEKMKEIAELPVWTISDEIYHGLVYEGKEHSMLEFTDKTFVLNGFSKLYAMTGLRLGYLIAPKDFVTPMQKLQQNFFISPNSMVQIAGIEALKNADDDVKEMKEVYNKRRIYMIKRLREMGLGITVEPTGAFYVFVNVKHISNDSYKLAFDILEKAKVGVTPGVDFGKNAEGYLRFSYANSIENIEKGMDRLEKYFEKYNKQEMRNNGV